MSLVKCGRVEPWIYGTFVVKYAGEPEPVTKPLICYMPCSQNATQTARDIDGLVFHWCDKHAAEPICGAVVGPAVESRAVAYADWAVAAQTHADSLGLPPDLWADGDPYDLTEAAAAAFTDGVDPKDFVEDAFGDDIARKAGADQDLADSLRDAMGEVES